MDLPKYIKKTILLRLLYSQIALYPIAAYLHKIISDSISRTNSHVNNSFDFYNSLSAYKHKYI